MSRFIEGAPRSQSLLFPERLDDWIAEDNPVRAVDAFVEELDLGGLGFERAEAADTGRPAYHPADLLKIYIYGYMSLPGEPMPRPRRPVVWRPANEVFQEGKTCEVERPIHDQ